MQAVYVGFDYEQKKRFRVYFNLLQHALRAAIDRQCRLAYFGQTSYDIKARPGASPYPLTAYMKHRLRFVHNMLRANKGRIFPKVEAANRSPVFRVEGEPD